MNRAFLLNILFLVSINLLIKPFFIFGVDRTVQNVVGAETYGVYFALLSLTYLFGIINDFGIQNFNNRSIAQNPNLIQDYFPNIMALKLLLGIGYLTVIFITAWISNISVEYWHILLFLSVNMMLASLVFYLRSNISGLGMYRTDSIISALDKLFMIAICSILLWGPGHLRESFLIEWFVYAQTVSFSATAVVAFWIIKRHLVRLHFQVAPRFLFSLLKKSSPYALVIFLMSIYTRIDAVMVERLLPDGERESGIYGAAYRLLDASNMIGFLFAGLLLPMFAKMIQQKTAVVPLVRMSARMIWAGAIPLSITTWFFRQEIAYLLYIEATPYWGEVLGWLMISFIAVSGTYIFGTLLTANGNLQKMNRILVVAVVLNIGFNALLIPYYKALGAALATVITQFFAMLAQLYLAGKEFNWRYDLREISRILIFGIAVTGICYSVASMSEIPWIIRFTGCLVLSILMAFLLKLLDLKFALGLVAGKIRG